MGTFVFYRTSENNHINTAALLSAHGFSVLGEPTTYIRILGRDRMQIGVREGNAHQSLYTVEGSIEQFISLSALLDNGKGAAENRHIVLDIPLDTFVESDTGTAIDLRVIPILSSPAHEFFDRNGPLLRKLIEPRKKPDDNSLDRDPMWLLTCGRQNRGRAAWTQQTAVEHVAISKRLSVFYRTLPYQIPALSRVERASLLEGNPLPAARRAGTLLAWALLFAARSEVDARKLEGSGTTPEGTQSTLPSVSSYPHANLSATEKRVS
ncbi:hypothetical protein [Microvirga sesbaniae]|uniref:hypothetical protein n=1 Tax=Microvirga sesbaniae TaxID=681392 RepID=UPI0021C6613F|nr:hypothetical protein [Microvirga sp. HBU67692]